MKLLKSASLATALFLSSCAAPQIRENNIPANPPQREEVRVPDEQRPSYLQPLPSSQDIARMSPVERLVLQYTQNARDMQNNVPNLLFTNNSPRRVIMINGSPVSIELPYYLNNGENQIREIISGNLDNANTVFLDLERLISRANNIVLDNFERIDAESNRRVHLRTGDIDQNSPVEGIEGTTLGQVLGIQHHSSSSLLPRKFILGHLDSAYAITRLHEDVVVYSPFAREVDEIWGQPRVVAHELWHISQSIIDQAATNVELYAYAMDLKLASANPLTLLTHPYGEEARELAWEYYRLDSDAVIRESIKDRISNLVELDEQSLNRNYPNILRLSNRFGDLLQTEVEPEYRSFSPYWAMMQEYYRNKNLLLRLALVKNQVPAGLNNAARIEFLIKNRAALNRIFDETRREYVTPPIISFGPFRFINGKTIEDLIDEKCRNAGFNEEQTEYAFHLYLKRTFFNSNGSYNYNNISLANATNAMKNFTQGLEITNEQYSRYFPHTTDEVKSLVEIYNWYFERLEIASRYHAFAETQGLDPNDNFIHGIFDPHFNLENYYHIRPGYTHNTSNASLRGSNRISANGSNYTANNYDLINDKGFSNGVDYISVFRIKSNGQQETNPCMVLFASNNSQTPNFALIDSDKEGEEGYGIYDTQKPVTERTTIESLLNDIDREAVLPIIPNNILPQHGRFILPDYSSWQSSMHEYDADLDGRIDSVSVLYQNGDKLIRELYGLPQGYDNALVTEQGILLSKRGLFELVQIDSLNKPYAVQITENEAMTTFFDNDGNGVYRQRIK